MIFIQLGKKEKLVQFERGTLVNYNRKAVEHLQTINQYFSIFNSIFRANRKADSVIPINRSQRN